MSRKWRLARPRGRCPDRAGLGDVPRRRRLVVQGRTRPGATRGRRGAIRSGARAARPALAVSVRARPRSIINSASASRPRDAPTGRWRPGPGSHRARPCAASAARGRDELLRQFHDRGRFAALEELLDAGPPRHGPGRGGVGASPRPALALRGSIRRGQATASGRVGPCPRTRSARFATSGCSMPSRSRSRWCGASSTRPRGQAPDDDRVWLGRANLATWSGRFEEADRWLARLPRAPSA